MDALLEYIRTAVADGASHDMKHRGAEACRKIIAALEAEPGKPLSIASAPAPHPLAGIDPEQALDMLIAKLAAALPTARRESSPAPAPVASAQALRIAFVSPPALSARSRNRRPSR